jgi:hypothetical protein
LSPFDWCLILLDVELVVEDGGTYFVENTEFHHKNLNNIDREEPIYSEPIFTLPEHTSVRQNIVTSLIKKLETNIEHESQLDFYSKHQSKGDNEHHVYKQDAKEAGVYRCKDEYRNQHNEDDTSQYMCGENDKLEYSGDNDDGDNLIYKDDHDQYMYQYLLSRGLVTKSNSAGFLISQCLASSHSPDSGYLSYPRYQHTGSLSSNTNSTSSNQEEHDKPPHKPGKNLRIFDSSSMIMMLIRKLHYILMNDRNCGCKITF